MSDIHLEFMERLDELQKMLADANDPKYKDETVAKGIKSRFMTFVNKLNYYNGKSNFLVNKTASLNPDVTYRELLNLLQAKFL